MSMSSKLVAMSITYPYQVVRSRAQIKNSPSSSGHQLNIVEILKRTWKVEGLRGFYKGIVPSALRVLPGTGITFLIYENCTKYLQSQ